MLEITKYLETGENKDKYEKTRSTTNDTTDKNIENDDSADKIDESTECQDSGKDTKDANDVPAMSDAERIKRIRELIANSEISDPEKWEKLTVEERKEIIRKLASDIAKVLGINEAKIVFRDMGKNIYGSYDRLKREIHINNNLVSDPGQRLNLLDTLNHEYRHAFQHDVVLNPEKYPDISPDVVKAWKNNFANYLPYYLYGFELYAKQPVERDAFEFEEKIRGDKI